MWGMDIFRAAGQGNEEEVSRLLDDDPTLLTKHGSGYDTPLVRAAVTGQLGVARLLVRRGADLDGKGAFGRTALHHAAQEGHAEVVAFLLSKGARADLKDFDRRTPLIVAYQFGHLSVMQVLLQHMGTRGQRDLQAVGWTPLMEAAGSGHLSVVQTLVQDMGEEAVEKRDSIGRTALHWAACGGHGESVAILLSRGAQADRRDRNRVIPLMAAAKWGHLGVVQMLVHHMGGQGLGAKDDGGKTALHHAADKGHEEIMEYLLGQGAPANVRDKDGRTPLILATLRGQVSLLQVLVPHVGAEGMDVKDREGNTALLWAAGSEDAEVVAFLLSHGAQVDIKDGCGSTPLMEALSRGHMKVVQVLLRHMGGQGLDEGGRRGKTALHHAVEKGQEEATRILLYAGADPTVTDNKGHTPYATAERSGQVGCADLIDERVAAGQALPRVEIVTRQEEEHQVGARDTTHTMSEAGSRDDEERQRAVLAYVVTQLNEQLFDEFMPCFHGLAPDPDSGSDGSDAEGDDGSYDEYDEYMDEDEYDFLGEEYEESEDEEGEDENT